MKTIIFDFRDEQAIDGWQPVDDVVMGGVSSSRLERAGSGAAAFTGAVSLDRGGGFASVRSCPQKRDLSRYTSLSLRIRGDGRRYKVNLRTDLARRDILYASMFETRAGEWQDVTVPFEELQPTFRGRLLEDCPPLDPSRVTSVGLMISDRQAGPFRLEIARIEVC